MFGDGQGQPVRLLSAGNELGRADYRAAGSHGRHGQLTSLSRVFHRHCGVCKKKGPAAAGAVWGTMRFGNGDRDQAPTVDGSRTRAAVAGAVGFRSNADLIK